MKLLLINSPIDILDTLGKFSSIYDSLKQVPSGLALLAAFVREHGVEVKILDQYSENLPMDAVLQRIRAFDPQLIGVNATTPNYAAAIAFVRRVKAAFPETPLVMGGYHPSILPDETLSEASVDFVVRDEGEEILLNLCRHLESSLPPLSTILGLSYKETDGTRRHNPGAPKVELDSLPLPAFDLLPMHLYSSAAYMLFDHPVFQVHASRGCIYKCTFCINADLKVSALYRPRHVSRVVDEIQLLVETYHARQIQFWDPLFPLGRKHALAFCEELTRRGLHRRIVWSCTTRAEVMCEEAILAMRQAGCVSINFGIESGVPELLDAVKKRTNLDKVRQIVRFCRQQGLVVSAGFIFGFPGESRAMSQQTLDFAKSLDLHFAQFSIMVPYPGTPMYTQLIASGELQPVQDKDYRAYNQNIGNTGHDPAYIPKGRTAEELKEFQRHAYRAFYLRPAMVWRHLPHLRWRTLKVMTMGFLAVVRSALTQRPPPS